MTRRSIAVTVGATLVAAAATALSVPASAVAGTNPGSGSTSTTHSIHTCSQSVPKGFAACLAEVVTTASGTPKAVAASRVAPNATPSGYGPSDIQSAYNLSGAASGGATVAIVDAYDDPTAESDLAAYRSTYGLPECSTANGCFSKVDQDGGSSYPATDAGWATEISLDVDMVSATCPDCHILLVEADSPSFANLGAAVNTAASLGAVAISNSYGGSDSSASSAYDHPGIAITASTGDGGYEVESPASYDTVVAVGGTSLYGPGDEAAWSGAGSGCSTINAKPSWQSAATQCSGKANADVSAVADPATGVAVYDTTAYQGASGWQVYGGTSASSPIIASVFALGGVSSSYPAADLWANPGALNDVTSGSNGSCSTAVWCTAGAGWDGPTGLGTPNGTGAF